MTFNVENYSYGTEEFGDTLRQIAEEYDFTPIPDMLQWSKDYYNEHINVFPATIAHFIKMTIDKTGADEEVLAGWILTFNAILTSKEKLSENGMPREAQLKVITELYKEVQERSKYMYYHVHNYFHTNPVFVREFNEKEKP